MTSSPPAPPLTILEPSSTTVLLTPKGFASVGVMVSSFLIFHGDSWDYHDIKAGILCHAIEILII